MPNIGFFQIEATTPKAALWERLFSKDTPEAIRQNIYNINTHLNDPARAGEIVIIVSGSQPETDKEKKHLADLQIEAKAASQELAGYSDGEADTMHRHFDLLEWHLSDLIVPYGPDRWNKFLADQFAKDPNAPRIDTFLSNLS